LRTGKGRGAGKDSWLLDKTLGVLVPVKLGAIGWSVSNWLGNPLLRVYRLRSEAVELIFQTVNVGSKNDPDQINRLRPYCEALLPAFGNPCIGHRSCPSRLADALF